jgi:hypothetical protein
MFAGCDKGSGQSMAIQVSYDGTSVGALAAAFPVLRPPRLP